MPYLPVRTSVPWQQKKSPGFAKFSPMAAGQPQWQEIGEKPLGRIGAGSRGFQLLCQQAQISDCHTEAFLIIQVCFDQAPAELQKPASWIRLYTHSVPVPPSAPAGLPPFFGDQISPAGSARPCILSALSHRQIPIIFLSSLPPVTS